MIIQKGKRARLPSISFVVARSYPGNVIGYKNTLPWHLSTDLKRFRKITTGHVVIMGRHTHESIGRPLPNRTNIVMSKNEGFTNKGAIDFSADTQLVFVNSREEALFFADVISICRERRELFVVGGQTMYSLFEKFVNKAHLTQVSAQVPGDAFFEMDFPHKIWRTVQEASFPKSEGIDDYPYLYSELQRRERRDRAKFVGEFMTEIDEKKTWIASNIDFVKSRIERYAEENPMLDL